MFLCLNLVVKFSFCSLLNSQCKKLINSSKYFYILYENDTDFNASSKTGGEKTHKLTIEELPINSFKANGSSGDWTYLGVSSIKPHNNMQPYYTCYIFVRTA